MNETYECMNCGVVRTYGPDAWTSCEDELGRSCTRRPTMRPIMTRAELASHEIGQHGRDYSKSDDGYSDMEVAADEGWHAISGWGSDGWDLGDWPYVVISVRDRAPSSKCCGECGTITSADTGGHELRQTCEGDTTAYRFSTREDRSAAIDYLCIWYGDDIREAMGLTDEAREALDAGTLRVPERFRGPYQARTEHASA